MLVVRAAASRPQETIAVTAFIRRGRSYEIYGHGVRPRTRMPAVQFSGFAERSGFYEWRPDFHRGGLAIGPRIVRNEGEGDAAGLHGFGAVPGVQGIACSVSLVDYARRTQNNCASK